MLTFLHQTAESVNDGARCATFHYESSHAALLLIICTRCETWTTAKVLTLKHLTGSIIFTRVCVFNELLFHMLHEALYEVFFLPKFFLKLPRIFPCREKKKKKKSNISARGCFSCRRQLCFLFFFPTLVTVPRCWKKCRLQEWYNIQDRVIISYAREAPGWWCSRDDVI